MTGKVNQLTNGQQKLDTFFPVFSGIVRPWENQNNDPILTTLKLRRLQVLMLLCPQIDVFTTSEMAF